MHHGLARFDRLHVFLRVDSYVRMFVCSFDLVGVLRWDGIGLEGQLDGYSLWLWLWDD